MPLSRQTLERQLQAANADLAAYAKTLQEKGLTEAEFKRNTKWRSLNAGIRTVRRRLAAVTQTETNNAAVSQHKAERLAAASASANDPDPKPSAKDSEPKKSDKPKPEKQKK